VRECLLLELHDRTISYMDGLKLQKKAYELVIMNNLPGVLILLRHSPVITIGKSGGLENLRVSLQDCKKIGIQVHETDRGGNITFHGPGQLIGYPILNLEYWKKDLHWYVSSIEDLIIDTLRGYGIDAIKKYKYRGVWVEDRKIAAIGITIKKWVTMHGFAIQVNNQSINYFELINPCGITNCGVISLEDLISKIEVNTFVSDIKSSFARNFRCIFDTATFPYSEDVNNDCKA